MPMESTWAEFWNVVFMPGSGPPVLGRQAVHHTGPVGGAEGGHGEPGEEEQDGEHPVGEVDGQQLEQDKQRPAPIMPPVAKGRAP